MTIKKMKLKSLFSFLSIFTLFNLNAQVAIDCSSHRFDQEVFQAFNVTSNISYGSNTDVNNNVLTLKLDLYEPAGDTLSMRPLIVWVHGGSFVGGTKNDIDVVTLCQHFAKRGYVCVSIDYRLGFSVFPPDSKAATESVIRAMQDMKAAIRFFRKDAATVNTYRINPSLIFGGGSSAGAFTALHAAYLNEPSEIPTEIDTLVVGGIEGNSGNLGYSSDLNAVIDLCGALGNKTWIHSGDIPFVAMHGDQDGTVPYATATIYLLGTFPVAIVDGSYSISDYANSIGLPNEMYTFYGADHVPYAYNSSYMDTTVRFVSNFLYRHLGCNPSDPTPLANTFTTGINDEISLKNLSVYPNPGNGIFKFKMPENKKSFHLSIFDVDGRKIIDLNNFGQDQSLDMSSFNPGVYFYKMEIINAVYSGKLFIEH